MPSSAIFYIERMQSRLKRPALFSFSREFLEPRVQGLFAINGFVGRFSGKKIHWTFFYFHLTPFSMLSKKSFDDDLKFKKLLLSKNKSLVKMKRLQK